MDSKPDKEWVKRDDFNTRSYKVKELSFGTINIDGKDYFKDIVIHKGKIEIRKKKESKHFRDRFGHTPLSISENIPWDCKKLIIINLLRPPHIT